MAAPPVAGGVTYERLRNAAAEPHNWLMYWGNYHSTHYSPLKSIDSSNVGRLRAAWSMPVPGRERQRELADRRRRRDVCDERRRSPHGHGTRRADRPADLAIHAAAESPQPVRDRCPQPRRGHSRPSSVRGHQRRGAHLPRRANGLGALGDSDRRHDGGLQHHQPAAHREGQGHRGAGRGGVSDSRVSRRLRCLWQAAVAVLHDSRTRRARQRDMEGRQLEDRRRINLVDGQLRSRARHAVLGDWKSGAGLRSAPAR